MIESFHFRSFLLTCISVAIWLFVCGCSAVVKEPEFKTLNNIRVSASSPSEMVIQAEAVFFNPNNYDILVREVNVDVAVDNKDLGNVTQEIETTAEAKKDFSVPIVLKFSPDLLYDNVVQGLLSMITKKDYEVSYAGYVRGKAMGVPFKVPVKATQKVKI